MIVLIVVVFMIWLILQERVMFFNFIGVKFFLTCVHYKLLCVSIEDHKVNVLLTKDGKLQCFLYKPLLPFQECNVSSSVVCYFIHDLDFFLSHLLITDLLFDYVWIILQLYSIKCIIWAHISKLKCFYVLYLIFSIKKLRLLKFICKKIKNNL